MNSDEDQYLPTSLLYLEIPFFVDPFGQNSIAVTLKTKTLIKGIMFLLFIFYFAWEAVVEYKLHKAKQKEDDI